MATDFGQYVPLKELVSMTLDECEKSMGDFDRVWIMSFRALVDLTYDVSAQPASFRIPLNGNKTATLPSNYILWTKIGVLNNAGEVSTLKINNGLTKYKDNNPNRIQDLTADVQNAFPLLVNSPYYFNFITLNGFRPLYGVGGGLIQYGECVVDEENGLVVLSPEFQYDHIILECIISPEKNGDYQVPTSCQEAVIAFNKWKLKLGSRDEYIAAKKDARRRMPKKRVTLQYINQIIRENTSMSLRS